MSKITWANPGDNIVHTGTDRGVLYVLDEKGAYQEGVAWNGLTGVSDSSEGAEETAFYANNTKYGALYSAEVFKGEIKAYTSPEEFDICDGAGAIVAGVKGANMTGQTRRGFGLTFRTMEYDAQTGAEAGYIIHLVYNARASVASKEYATINDSPEAIEFSWSFSTSPVQLKDMRSSAHFTIDSRTAPKKLVKALEDKLYGENGKATLPTPDELVQLINDNKDTAAVVPGVGG